MIENVMASIVRVRRETDEQIVGAGFLVDANKKTVITCAHVVNTAIDNPTNQRKPLQLVIIDFPGVAKGQMLQSRVIAFVPKQVNGSGDIAVLQVIDDLPKNVQPVKMIVSATHADNEFCVMGFPQAFEDEGRWAEGKLQQRLINRQMQAVGTNGFGYFVEQGFSGSPVYDKKLHAVMGMMTRIDTNTSIRAAFLTPLDVIKEVYPEIKYGWEEDAHSKEAIPRNIFFSSVGEFESYLELLAPREQFSLIYSRITSTIIMALQIFIVSTVRIYQNEIINESEPYIKKVGPIKNYISEAFRNPSLITLVSLAQKCTYLIDAKAPEPLVLMKRCLLATIELNDIGQVWDDLESIFVHDKPKSRLANKYNIRRDLLLKLLPELARYLSKPVDVFEHNFSTITNVPSMRTSIWIRALEQIIDLLQPIFSNPFVLRSVSHHNPLTGKFTFEVKTYTDDQIHFSSETVEHLSDEHETQLSELILADNRRIATYPFILLREDALFYYRRTTTLGYEYYSILLNKTYVEPTKAKFSQTLFPVGKFQVGSSQDFFWTDVVPITNQNGIRANIPADGPSEFIGRRKQLNNIKETIVNIVNENGIIYGPGGMGKTSLIIQLTKELYEEKDHVKDKFDNIIWVSAKQTFYDYIFDNIEKREPQVRSLDTILVAILKFFELGDVEEYTFEDRKALVLELMRDFKILLIVDNFETLKKKEKDNIIEFFGTTVKKELQNKPANFKIILTSRELVPSGFRQIELTGMDKNDAKRLIDSLYKRYQSQPALTVAQKETIYERTNGLPILIKHCIAKIYEYGIPFEGVIRNLEGNSSNIVQFSFGEILEEIGRENNKTSLELIILLEVAGIPLMLRQMADILEINERYVEEKLPLLTNFECIRRSTQDNQEKYELNDEIQLLTKSLMRKHYSIYQHVRTKYYRNFSFDRRMDYDSEEETIVNTFEDYLRNDEPIDAKDFLERELKRRPDSILLNYYYARYLKDHRNEVTQAIQILEDLRSRSGNHPSVLKLLFLCYAAVNMPRFENAEDIVTQVRSHLGDYLEEDIAFQLDIARFYIRWSISIKLTIGLDPFEENMRQANYKELAEKALEILIPLEKILRKPHPPENYSSVNLHEVYYRMSQCYYNLWDNDAALKSINHAIRLVQPSSSTLIVLEYKKFRTTISGTRDYFKNQK